MKNYIELSDADWELIYKNQHRMDLALIHYFKKLKKSIITMQELKEAGFDANEIKNCLNKILRSS